MRKFVVVTQHDVYEDHYENGEGKQVNSYTLESTQKANKWLDAVIAHLSEHCFEVNPEHIEVDEEDSTVARTAVTVDGGGLQATAEELQQWMGNNLELFSEHIHITISTLEDFDMANVAESETLQIQYGILKQNILDAINTKVATLEHEFVSKEELETGDYDSFYLTLLDDDGDNKQALIIRVTGGAIYTMDEDSQLEVEDKLSLSSLDGMTEQIKLLQLLERISK